MTVLVTNMEGKPLPEIWVKASGPVDREAATDPSGTVVFNNVTTGSYRLRFENEQFVTLERDVTVAAGRPLKASVALNAAPPPPPPPKVEPAPPPAAPSSNAPVGNFQPSAVVVEKLIEADFIGRAASKRAAVGCSASTTSTLFQTNEPVPEHTHADTEETIYVVVGEGTLNVGGRDFPLAASSFVTIPRGISHSMTRRGSRPLMFVSTLSGQPCSGK
jgi:quercetin dioxygenase-like cupin family protein